MSQKNMGRLAQDMKREIIAIIGRLTDPRLEGGLLTVTRLDVTPDLDVACLLYTSWSCSGPACGCCKRPCGEKNLRKCLHNRGMYGIFLSLIHI